MLTIGSVEADLAPYALVRQAALDYPADPPETSRFRHLMERLVALRSEIQRIAPDLAEALYHTTTDHSAAFHRRVVLPLRRSVHNGRLPPRADLGDLPERVPQLRAWLVAQERLAHLEQALDPDAALAAERLLLAQACRGESLRRAVAMSGRELLRGVDRMAAAGGRPDARARKAEPTILRYALRASAKTSPLSWFATVGWTTPEATCDGGPAIATSRVNRLLLTRLAAALLTDPGRRESLPHRLAPGLRRADGRMCFLRDAGGTGAGRAATAVEQEVSLPDTGALRWVVDAVRAHGATTPSELIERLAAQLPGTSPNAAAGDFVRRLLDLGLLIAVEPIHPQSPDYLSILADQLRSALGPALRDAEADTKEFSRLPVERRPEAIAALGLRWQQIGEAVGADLTGVTPLTEDVVLARPQRSAHFASAAALPALTGLAELFDRQLLVRRILCERFVERHGPGGRAEPTSFAAELAAAWKVASGDGPAGPQAQELLRARAELIASVPPGSDEETVLSAEVLKRAADLVPRWVTARPVSYSYFVQPAGQDLVVNHIYAGFGRFTSRFLDQLDVGARDAVAAQLRRVFGERTPAQFRPAAGFNANLHPLLTGLEVGEDSVWADLAIDALELWHDPVADQLRLRSRDTGEPLDVIYQGLLMPFLLPDRTAALYTDLACGQVDLSPLRPVRPGFLGRLRHNQIVLARRSWGVNADQVAQWRDDLAGRDIPASAAAHWRARLGLPERVFLSGARPALRTAEDFQRYFAQPKPQYVDFGNALHLRCLSKLLGRHTDGATVTEALPIPGTQGRVTELIIETYRRAR